MQLALMIEGQEGVSWPQWRELAATCEQSGVPALFRSDHLGSLDQHHPERASLDALGTCIALGAVTTTLRLGTMVSPASFRHPSVLAKLATTADHVSGGRFELGLGAGWHQREHDAFGFPFHKLSTRVDVLAEQLEVIHGHWQPTPFTFNGKHYHLDELDAQPKPIQQPHPPVILGGDAKPRAAALAARFATEYNTVFATPAQARERHGRIDAACAAAGRPPLRFSVMTAIVIGRDPADLQRKADAAARFRGLDAKAVLKAPPSGWLVGTVEAVAAQLHALSDAGVDRVMCQHMPHSDLDTVRLIGSVLGPMVA